MRLYLLWSRERAGPGWSPWCEDGRPEPDAAGVWAKAFVLAATLPGVEFEFLVLPVEESPYRVPGAADSWADPTWGEW